MQVQPERRLSPISRVSFSLTDRNAFEQAVDLSLEWLGRKAAGRGGVMMLPQAARDRQTFDVTGDEVIHPCHAVRIETAEGATWAARIEEPGSDPEAGVTWSTEVFVDRRPGEMTRFGVQLSRRAILDAPPLPPNRPNLVTELLTRLSAEEDRQEIAETVIAVPVDDVQRLAALLHSPLRRLPVVVLSIAEEGSVVAQERLAKRLCGAAHLFSLDGPASWELTRLTGRRMSTFGGAVRLYLPGIAEGDDDPFRHPLWLAGGRGGDWIVNAIAARVFPLGFADEAGGERFWRVAQLREMAAKEVAARAVGTAAETLQAKLNATEARVADLDELLRLSEGLQQQAVYSGDEARREADKLEDENKRLRGRIAVLEQHALGAGGAQAAEERRLKDYDDLEDWARETLGEHILIHKRAAKDCREKGHKAMLERIERCLLTLRDNWVPSKLKGGMARKNTLDQRFGEQGVEDSPCFKTRDKAKHDPSYCVLHEGKKMVLYDHFKYGNAYENDKQFRIYYHWIADKKLLLIGKMPSHLPTDQS